MVRGIYQNMNLKLKIAIVAVIALVFFSSIQFGFKNLASHDSYYHMKYAELIREQGLIKDMKWMWHSMLHEDFYDMHMLGHIFLIPFTFGDDDIFWGKIASVIFSSLLIVVFFWFLVSNKIKYGPMWTLLLMSSSYFFIHRLLYTRISIQLSIVFSILAFHFIKNEKSKALGILSLIYVWTYSAFLIPLIFCIIDMGIRFFQKSKINFKMCLYSGAGIVLGLIINPYFPTNIKILYFQLIQISLLRGAGIYNVEWSSPGILYLLPFLIILFGALVLSLVMVYINNRKVRYSREIGISLTIMVLFLILHLRAIRMVEYFVPFFVIFLAFLINHNIDKKEMWSVKNKRMMVLFFIVVLVGGGYNYSLIKRESGYFDTVNNYEGCGKWLSENTPKDSYVFIQYWDQMPALFFYSDNNVYTLGLEESFMYYHNKTLFKRYRDATDGIGNPYEIIKNDFKADYIFIYTGEDALKFYSSFKNESRIKAKYSDKFCAVFEVN